MVSRTVSRAVARSLFAALSSFVVLGACDVPENPKREPTTARFILPADGALPRFLDVPFPTDVYLASGRVVDPIPGLAEFVPDNAQFLTSGLAKLDGFSRIGYSLFYVDDKTRPLRARGEVESADLDPAQFPRTDAACAAPESAVFLIDLEAATPEAARLPCRVRFVARGSVKQSIAIGPARGLVLEEGHKYATVLTSRIKDDKGRGIAASKDFLAVAGGDRSTPVRAFYTDAIKRAELLLAPVLGDAKIVSLAPYSVQRTSEELFGLRESVDALPVPALRWDTESLAPMGKVAFAAPVGDVLPPGFTASLDDWLGVVDPKNKLPDGTDDPDASLPVRAHDKIAAIGTAVFDAPNFLLTRDGYNDLENGTFARDASGKIVPAPEKPTAKIWVTFAIPTSAPPAAGYPVVVLQHGLGGSRDYLTELANTFAKMGWATVAIDSITFGARARSARFTKDEKSGYGGDKAKYVGPDGMTDDENGPTDVFGELKNLGALRDQFRQAAIDTVSLIRLLRSPSLDLAPLATNGTPPKLDPERIVYVGDSLGAIQGTLAAAIEPSVKAWFMNVAGGGLFVEVAANAPAINILLSAAGGINFGFLGDAFEESHPLLSLGQPLIEAADPIAYAKYLVKEPHPIGGVPSGPRNIFQTEVIYDELVSNEGNEALAKAIGMGIATPNVGSNALLFDAKNPASNPNKVAFEELVPDAQGFHDTPKPGITAVLVQVAPAVHGFDLVRSRATRHYSVPYHADDLAPTFSLSGDYTSTCPYRELQAAMVRFLDDAIQGRVPVVTGFAAPVRDTDSDGNPDATDPAPADPNVR